MSVFLKNRERWNKSSLSLKFIWATALNQHVARGNKQANQLPVNILQVYLMLV
jgi:hypothetical protein